MAKEKSKSKHRQPKAFARPSTEAFREATARLEFINSMASRRRVPSIIYLSSDNDTSKEDEEMTARPSTSTSGTQPDQYKLIPVFRPTGEPLQQRHRRPLGNVGSLRMPEVGTPKQQPSDATSTSNPRQKAQAKTSRIPATPHPNVVWDNRSPTPGPSRPRQRPIVHESEDEGTLLSLYR
jgi:hypothetical protein